SEPYGMVPIQNAQPDTVPYGINPIPGYTPPAPVAPPAPVTPPAARPSSPPDALRGSVTETPAIPAGQRQDRYGYVPLRAPMPIAAPGSGGYGTVPLRPAEPLQPPLRASTATDDQDQPPA